MAIDKPFHLATWRNHVFNNVSESTNNNNKHDLLRFSLAVLFILGILLYTYLAGFVSIELMIAACIGGYMAINIGANDVANNVGPAVGSKALTLGAAILLAAVFESMGAILAGGNVISTIKKGIIDPSMIADSAVFIWLMISALLAGSIWLNLATAFGAPVSTTHSIVGGVLGAGIAAGGFEIANWAKMGSIAASWIISPLLGGIIAALFLYWIKRSITYKDNMIASSKTWVPILIGLMAWAFSTYLALKGLKKLWKIDIYTALGIGSTIAIITFFYMRSLISKRSDNMENNKESVNKLFTVPLIFAAALLSFAHGANDVANSIGPLAAINDAIQSGGVNSKAEIPLWIMVIGALGIALGLALYGPKLIRTVGNEITDLNQMRSFSVVMAAAITVIIASQLGLPVSSTHIAVGGIFGVGFLREYLKEKHNKRIHEVKHHHSHLDDHTIDQHVDEYDKASLENKIETISEIRSKRKHHPIFQLEKQHLVKRELVLKIAAAWVITVPATGLMAAAIFFAIKTFHS